MDKRKLLALYGLKYNPFTPDIPVQSLWVPPRIDAYCLRIENLVMEGGFALITGEPGLGKSKVLQILDHRLSGLDQVIVGVMERPQSSLNDFYREMGVLFGVNLSPANRYGGFKALRLRWKNHIESTLYRPVLLVDEAQEMLTCCMNELRTMSSERFDSKSLLTTIICGDNRLPERFRSTALVSLGTRMRSRFALEPYSTSELLEYLEYALEQAGAPHLMTSGLKETMVDHCSGNIRLLNNLGAELLAEAAQRKLERLDEKLFLELFSRPRRK